MITLLLLGCHIHSGLTVPAGERFVLGDNPHGSFRVRVQNTSDLPVAVQTTAAGAVVSETVLGPGAVTRARFSPSQAAVFVNDSDASAQLSVHVRGDVGLSMGYTPLP